MNSSSKKVPYTLMILLGRAVAESEATYTLHLLEVGADFLMEEELVENANSLALLATLWCLLVERRDRHVAAMFSLIVPSVVRYEGQKQPLLKRTNPFPICMTSCSQMV